MKCISRRLLSLVFVCCLILCETACGKTEEADANAYRLYESSYQYGLTKSSPLTSPTMFASGLCVTSGEEIGTEKVSSQVAYAGGLFDVTTKEVRYSQSMFEKMYPASTTKILTCYLALKYGNLDDIYTVSEHACDQEEDSSIADLTPGDKISLRALLYGLMLVSGNDAAIVIAENLSGSEAAFAELMNKEANALGATRSHFVTVNGMPDDEHYTCVYDMYLLFSAALSYEMFRDLIKCPTYSGQVTHKNGNVEQLEWETTNQYLLGKRRIPEGITIIGGKTGTTNEAGYCLVLYSQNEAGDDLISIVFHADSRGNLYYLMNEILYFFGTNDEEGT